MFAKNPKVERGIDRAFKLMNKMNRGDMLNHERIEEAFGIRRNSEWWSRGIDKLRKKMLADRGVWLASEPLIGYRLALPPEQLAEGPRRTLRAARQAARGLATVSALPDEELNFHQQRVKLGMEERLQAMEHSVRQQLRLQQYLMRPSEVQPRIAQEDDQAESA